MKIIKLLVALVLLVPLLIPPVTANISLSGGIGLHIFDLNKSTLTYKSQGSFHVTNKGNQPVVITLSLQTDMLGTDKDTEGNPRTHKVYTNDIVFYEIPDKNWISLDEKSKIIQPGETETFNYTVFINEKELDREQNRTTGYLGYIKIRGQESGPVGINYLHKVFICFEGERNTMGLHVALILSIMLTLLIYYIVIYRRDKTKKVRSNK